jgi:predicted RNA-binding protein (virulence factor B family)
MAGEFACLKVVSVTSLGAFLDWGLEKDLFVPFREQKQKMKKDHSYVVYIYLDTKSDRIAASSRLDKFLNREPVNYETGQEVTLLIVNETGVGYSAIVNGSHWGLLFKEDVFQSLEIGQQLQGYIKKVRPDKKIDLSLHKAGYDKIENISGKILQIIKEQGGSVDVTDKSSPEIISEMFGVSKKTFKIAIGALYRKRLIKIDKDHISLISPKV